MTFFFFIYIARPQAYYRRIFGHPLPEDVSIEHVALYDVGPDWSLFMKLQSPNKIVEKIIQQSNGKRLDLKITDGEIYFINDNKNRSIGYTPPAKKWWLEMNIKETQIYDISNNESETTIIMWDKKNKMVYCQCFS
jgi:hypothetical protein